MWFIIKWRDIYYRIISLHITHSLHIVASSASTTVCLLVFIVCKSPLAGRVSRLFVFSIDPRRVRTHHHSHHNALRAPTTAERHANAWIFHGPVHFHKSVSIVRAPRSHPARREDPHARINFIFSTKSVRAHIAVNGTNICVRLLSVSVRVFVCVCAARSEDNLTFTPLAQEVRIRRADNCTTSVCVCVRAI